MKNKFVKMTAAVLAGMMLLTGCGQRSEFYRAQQMTAVAKERKIRQSGCHL